ncbi:MAG: hypothetical protein ACRDDY_18600 [Clostridium sp.]|uniref:hypothetical protein n=1 Tax=Bacteria TaxID=2 RepID=UPI003EE7F311
MKLLFHNYKEKIFLKSDFILIVNNCLVYKDNKEAIKVNKLNSFKYIFIDFHKVHDNRNLIDKIFRKY